MAKDNEQYARQQELARAFEKTVAAREKIIADKVQTIASQMKLTNKNLPSVFEAIFVPAFASGKYEKPSQFFQKEMPWIFGTIVQDRFRDAFLQIADNIRDYSCGVSHRRRSYRSDRYLRYVHRLESILVSFRFSGYLDADICDILTGNISEGAICYLRTKEWRSDGFLPEVLAYELDRGNPRLERIVTDIINGENGFSTVSHGLIRGIVLSHNERMHQQLCKLLLAARLQEGLRQAICENADHGTKEAFFAILSTIAEHDLIRYSSVKRAVGTWLGLISEETRDLERVSAKSVALVQRCLQDEAFLEECLRSEDAMQVYIGLWSIAFHSAERAEIELQRICTQGTQHQVLAAGYYVNNLDNTLLRHTAAKTVLSHWRNQWDVLAVYLPCFVPYHTVLASMIVRNTPDPEVKLYFSSNQEAAEFCDWLVSTHDQLKKKEMIFDPCIFPWHKAVLTKSDLLEKAMVIAFVGKDSGRVEQLCPRLSEFGADGRGTYLQMLGSLEKTAPIRKALIDGLCDKSYYARLGASKILREMELTPEEYLAIEDMLRLRYEDLRAFATEFLLKQKDGALRESIRRLLSVSKTEKRTAALDMLLQMRKKAERTDVVETCMDYVRAIQNPTTQEKILIDQLLPKAAKPVKKVLFTEADRYSPKVEVDDFAKECIREFMAIFPDSKLESQVLAGKPVAAKVPLIKPKACQAAQKVQSRLEELSSYIVAHETEHFEKSPGYSVPISTAAMYFLVRDPKTQCLTAPKMELWRQWQTQSGVTKAELMGMCVMLSSQRQNTPYLKQCGRYVSNLFGPGFETLGSHRYLGHMLRIVLSLLQDTLDENEKIRFAAALGIWIVRCLPEDMLVGDDGKKAASGEPETDEITSGYYANHQMRASMQLLSRLQGSPVGHFISHPQFAYFLFWLKPVLGDLQKHVIPVYMAMFERTFASTRQYFKERFDCVINARQMLILDQIYTGLDSRAYGFELPGVQTYLYAHYYGLISEATLYYHLLDQALLSPALELVTSVCAVYPKEGITVAAKTFAGYRGNRMRLKCEALMGKESQDPRMIDLCHRVAETMLDVVLGAELVRGESMTEYSRAITGIQSLSGAETFVRILSALGKDPLDRNTYYYGHSGGPKRENLSYLLSRCAPAPEDTAETLGKLLHGTDITKKRLAEAAIHSPDWIDIIGQYLGIHGFKSACYYFMAHMNEQFDEQKKAIIARFTPLTDDELNMGAFDMDWFRSAYEQLGEKDFDLIYEAAKYISDGSKHTRARKFADAALGKLDVAATEAEVIEKRNKDLLIAYAIIPLQGDTDLSHRYFFLQRFLKESRQFGAQRSASEKKAVEAALRNLATNAGFSDTMRLTLRMETQLVEENADLFADRQVAEWVFRLDVDDQGSAEILCFKDGKQLKSLPAKAKKDPYVLRLTDMKKQLTEQYHRTRRMLEQAMEDGATFSLAELRDLCKNPVVRPMIAKLVFRSGEQMGFFNEENLVDLRGDVLVEDKNTQLTVAHPYHLYTCGQWPVFQKHLFDKQIIQPFRQVFRELYVKTADELGQFHSLRYAGNQIQPKKAAACLKERRWVADVEAGLQKVYYKENIVATIFAMADWFTPADIEAPTLEHVAFYHRKTGEALRIDDIPVVIFSEVMRDVDMAVSVAHAGGVDPETSHSTVEMRAAILSFTLPLLRLENVRVDGNHALVDGKLARYSIHLGSGVIHQIGGTMLSVLPVHSQHRGRIFLPFVDEDPKTAEIISKVILFGEDHKLKDPTILSQISR